MHEVCSCNLRFFFIVNVFAQQSVEGPYPAPSYLAFEEKYKLPAKYHTFHTRTYFNTMQVRIRGTEKWVMLLDKGRATSLDSPQIRALASRYGDPDDVLSTDWIPSIPGVNSPGNYETYAQDPYKYKTEYMEGVVSGEFETYHPYIRPPQ